MRTARFGNVLVFAALSGASACSLLVGGTKTQCAVDEDCARRGFPSAVCVDTICQSAKVEDREAGPVEAAPPTGPFRCLGNVSRPEAGTGKYRLTVPIVDLVSGAPVPGLTAKVCARLDVPCQNPLSVVAGNDDGLLVADVPAGFDGYLEVDKIGYCTGLVHMAGPVVKDTRRISSNFVQPGVVSFLRSAAAPDADLHKAVAFVSTTDCDDQLTGGVHVESDDDASVVAVYVVNGSPTTKVDRTGPEGRVGVLELDPGYPRVRCSVADGGQRIGEVAFTARPFHTVYDEGDASDASPSRCVVSNAICGPSP
ncbi:MAG: hypothetical protein HOO96_26205 [Polyangiaceae bacterium]|nr:hypothetical protein [Polyangiaceae bacterium]